MRGRAFGATIVAALLSSVSVSVFAQSAERPRVIHVFVALADNKNQGIVPVPAKLGNGADPTNNLYWGAAFGVKTFFKASSDWTLVSCSTSPSRAVLERCVFKHLHSNTYLIADAYQGSMIRDTVTDFLSAAARARSDSISIQTTTGDMPLLVASDSDVIAYVGHDAFMDFNVSKIAGPKDGRGPKVIVLACASKPFLAPYLRDTGSDPILWTTNLMAPEAYTLKAALDGWISGETGEQIRQRAAQAYDKYQKCGLHAAQKLFATGW